MTSDSVPAPVQRDFDGSPLAKRARMDVGSSAGGSKVAEPVREDVDLRASGSKVAEPVREEENSSSFQFKSNEEDVFSIPTEVARRSATIDKMLDATAGDYPYQMDSRLNNSFIVLYNLFYE